MKNIKNQITFPFLIIGDPIARRIAFPAIEILWFCWAAISVSLVLAITRYAFIKANDIGPMFMLGFFFLSVVFLLFLSANLAIKYFFYDILIIESDKIIHYSKIGKNTKEYNKIKIDKIVLEKYHGNHAAVVIYVKEGPQSLIHKTTILYGMRKLERFVEELGDRTTLKICSLVHE